MFAYKQQTMVLKNGMRKPFTLNQKVHGNDDDVSAFDDYFDMLEKQFDQALGTRQVIRHTGD